MLVAARDLVDDVRVGDMGSRHGHHIQQALADRIAGGGDIGDFRGVENRQPNLAFEGAGSLQPRCARHRHARHAFVSQRQFGIDAAIIGVDEVEQSCRFENTHDR